MADYDMMDDAAAPASAEDASVANGSNDTENHEKSEETEDQLSSAKALLRDQPKPGIARW
jgi:hypothetical protein